MKQFNGPYITARQSDIYSHHTVTLVQVLLWLKQMGILVGVSEFVHT